MVLALAALTNTREQVSRHTVLLLCGGRGEEPCRFIGIRHWTTYGYNTYKFAALYDIKMDLRLSSFCGPPFVAFYVLKWTCDPVLAKESRNLILLFTPGPQRFLYLPQGRRAAYLYRIFTCALHIQLS